MCVVRTTNQLCGLQVAGSRPCDRCSRIAAQSGRHGTQLKRNDRVRTASGIRMRHSGAFNCIFLPLSTSFCKHLAWHADPRTMQPIQEAKRQGQTGCNQNTQTNKMSSNSPCNSWIIAQLQGDRSRFQPTNARVSRFEFERSFLAKVFRHFFKIQN